MSSGYFPKFDAIVASRFLNSANQDLQVTFERLSSGLRVNTASDDAAGFAVANNLSTKSSLHSIASTNISSGISLLNLADDALNELSSIVRRQQELATQSANGVFSAEQRLVMQSEASALSEEYNRILSSTEYNGFSLLDDGGNQISIQAGISDGDAIAVNTAEEIDFQAGTGSFTAGQAVGSSTTQKLADLNGDSILDLAYMSNTGTEWLTVAYGNGNGTFTSPSSASTVFATSTGGLVASDFDGDGDTDFITNNDIGGNTTLTLHTDIGATYSASTITSFGTGGGYLAELSDLDGDGDQDVLYGATGSSIRVLMNNNDGTFESIGTGLANFYGNRITTGDLNNDGNQDVMTFSSGSSGTLVYLGNGDGSFSSVVTYTTVLSTNNLATGDFNFDGKTDLVVTGGITGDRSILLGNGDGTFQAQTTITGHTSTYQRTFVADMNLDGNLDLIGGGAFTDVIFGNGDGTFGGRVLTGLNGSSGQLGDLNSDGVLDLYTTNRVILANTTSKFTMPDFNISTAQEAQRSLGRLQSFADRLTVQKGAISAGLSRLSSSLSVSMEMRSSMDQAVTAITDADVAQEVARSLKLQILQESNVALLAQLNGNANVFLKLLE